MGNFIHVLLVVAIIIVLVRVIQGGSPFDLKQEHRIGVRKGIDCITMRNFFAGLFLAVFLPFIVGFSDVPPDKNSEQVAVKETILFPQGQLFYPPMASPKEPRTHVTYLRLNLPGDTINVGSVGFGDSFGLVRWPGWGKDDAWQLSISGAVLAQFNLELQFHGSDQRRLYHRFSAKLPERFLVSAGAPLPPVLPPGGRVSPPAAEPGAEGNAHELKLRDH